MLTGYKIGKIVLPIGNYYLLITQVGGTDFNTAPPKMFYLFAGINSSLSFIPIPSANL